MRQSKILIVDDESKIREQIIRLLHFENFETDEAKSGEEALQKISNQDYSVIVLDIMMPGGMDGFQFLEQAKTKYPDICIIILTDYGSTENIVRATKMGAFDFLDKPNYVEELIPRIRRAIEQSPILREAHEIKQAERNKAANIIGQSKVIKKVFSLIERVANQKTSVLIQGESGTGKELVALAIHHNSDRANKSFLPVNCSALAETLLESELFGHEKGAFTGAIRQKKGKFELADEGTLFLDEIGEITQNIQVKLLRFLEDNKFERVGSERTIEVDVRIIAATNKNLLEAVNEKQFREDLFYRLNVFPINLPPLRERTVDIPLLVDHFLKKYNSEIKKNIIEIAPDALELLLQYDYPGNIRELENIIERALILQDGHTLQSETLANCFINQRKAEDIDYVNMKFQDAKPLFEQKYIENILRKTNFNISQAAKLVGMDRSNFKEKMRKYGIAKQ